jgi:hypothetical protein
MPLRKLTEIERQRLEKLTANSVDISLIQPTRTGLEKSILDATAPIRNYLLENDLHDYHNQGQGMANRVYIEAQLLGVDGVTESRASLYRPETKSGDPRIWFRGLPDYAAPDDMIAITAHEGRLLLINLTQIDIVHVLDQLRSGPLWEAIQTIGGEAREVSDELLVRLRQIAARGLLASVMEDRADTAIGRTLEAALGIQMNANRAPDYRGIELKSYRRAGRASRENRKTLFARVPNWKISKYKSSAQILDAFGYQREDDFKLYCTISTQRRNSQGLFFRLNEKDNQLDECSTNAEIGAFASWLMADLRQALLEKHNETFWIGGTSEMIDEREHFRFLDVLHTRKPILSQFDILLEQGEITMDHLIKRNAKGRVSEKGPLFKINTPALGLLFPPSQEYDLTQ